MKLGLVLGMLLATGMLLTLATPLASANATVINGISFHCYGYASAVDSDSGSTSSCIGVSKQCTGKSYYWADGSVTCSGVRIGI